MSVSKPEELTTEEAVLLQAVQGKGSIALEQALLNAVLAVPYYDTSFSDAEFMKANASRYRLATLIAVGLKQLAPPERAKTMRTLIEYSMTSRSFEVSAIVGVYLDRAQTQLETLLSTKQPSKVEQPRGCLEKPTRETARQQAIRLKLLKPATATAG